MNSATLQISIEVDDKGSVKIRQLGDTAKKAGEDGKKGFDGMKSSADQADTAFGKLGNSANIVSTALKAIVASAIVKALTDIGRSSLQAASDLEETQNKFDVVFRGLTEQAEQWSTELQDSFVMSERASKQYLSSIQDLLVPTGMARDAAGEMSMEFVKLAADLGSFNNIPTEQVVLDIQSALQGSSETMAKYGINVKQAKVEQEIFTLGLASTKDEITDQHKAMAILSISLREGADAIGDVSRSSESFAYQQRVWVKNIEDVSAAFGERLLPIATAALQDINSFLSDTVMTFARSDDAVGKLVEAMKTLAEIAGAGAGMYLLQKAIVVAQTAMLALRTATLTTTASIQASMASSAGSVGLLTTSLYGTQVAMSSLLSTAGLLKMAFAGFIGVQIGTYLYNEFETVRLAGLALVDGLIRGWIELEYAIKATWVMISNSFGIMLDVIRSAFAAFLDEVASSLEALPSLIIPQFGTEALVIGFDDAAQSVRGYASELRVGGTATATVTAELAKLEEAKKREVDVHNITIEAIRKEHTARKDGNAAIVDQAKESDKTTGSTKNLGAASNDAAKELDNQASSTAKAAKETKYAGEEHASFTQEVEKLKNSNPGAALAILEKNMGLIAAGTEEATKNVNWLSDAYDTLGITSRKSYEEQVSAATSAYETIMSVSTTTTEEQERARTALQEKLIALDEEYTGKAVETNSIIETSWNDLTESTKDTMTDWVENSIKGQFDSIGDAFRSLTDSMLSLFIDMITKMIAEWAMSGIAGMISGNGLSGFSVDFGSIGSDISGFFSGGSSGGSGSSGAGSLLGAGALAYGAYDSYTKGDIEFPSGSWSGNDYQDAYSAAADDFYKDAGIEVGKEVGGQVAGKVLSSGGEVGTGFAGTGVSGGALLGAGASVVGGGLAVFNLADKMAAGEAGVVDYASGIYGGYKAYTGAQTLYGAYGAYTGATAATTAAAGTGTAVAGTAAGATAGTTAAAGTGTAAGLSAGLTATGVGAVMLAAGAAWVKGIGPALFNTGKDTTETSSSAVFNYGEALAAFQSGGSAEASSSQMLQLFDSTFQNISEIAASQLPGLSAKFGETWVEMATSLDNSLPAFDRYLDGVTGVDVSLQDSARIYDLAKQATMDNGASMYDLAQAMVDLGMGEEMARGSAIAMIASLGELAPSVDTVTANNAMLAQSLEIVGAKNGNWSHEIEGFGNNIDTARASTALMILELNGVQSHTDIVKEKFNELSGEMAGTSQEQDIYNLQLAEAQVQADLATGKLQVWNAETGEFQSSSDTATGKLGVWNNEIGGFQSFTDTATGSLGDWNGEINGFYSYANNATDGLGTWNNEIGAFQGDVSSATNQLDGWNNEINGFQSDANSAASQLSNLNGALDDSVGAMARGAGAAGSMTDAVNRLSGTPLSVSAGINVSVTGIDSDNYSASTNFSSSVGSYNHEIGGYQLFADGGILTRPTQFRPGMIGGEAGYPEAIIPLRHPKQMNDIEDKVDDLRSNDDRAILLAIARGTKKTADLLQRFEMIGLPGREIRQ